MKRNIIFLDIDGVMNRFNLCDVHKHLSFPNDIVCNLNYLIEQTNSLIVISSTWKVNSCYMDVLEEDLFPLLPKGCVIGCTPTIIPQVNREIEIQQWLDKNQDIVDNYVILDDYDFELKSFVSKGVCVITDAMEGLTMKDCTKAIQILKGGRNEN